MEFLPRRFIRTTTQTGRRDFFRHQLRQRQKIFSAGSARVVCPPRCRDRRRVCFLEAKAGRLRVMNQPPKLWIVAERPVRLPNALVAAESLRGRFPGGIHFVCDESAAWDNVQWQLYARYFDNVYTFPRVKSSRGLRDLPRLYRQTLNRKTAVADLPIDPDTDVLLCFAGVMGLSTLVATVHRPVYKVLSISSSSYERLTRTPNRRQFRFTTSGWLQNRVVEPIAGVERT